MPRSSALKKPSADVAARQRIIDAARELFASRGFDGASTRQIADQAGVAQSLLLYHFGSKEVLWKSVIDDTFEWANEIAQEFLSTNATHSVKDRIVAGIKTFVHLCAERPDFHRLMTLEGRTQSERLKWMVETHLKPMFKQNTDLLRQGQKIGVVRPGDPTLLHYGMIGIAGTAYAFAPEISLLTGKNKTPDPNAVEHQICTLLLLPSEDK